MPRTFEQFEVELVTESDSRSGHEYRLFKAQKKVKIGDLPHQAKYQNSYYLKQVKHSQHEVAIMEFYRLLIPKQPKYRAIRDIYQHSHYVQSTAIQGLSLREIDKNLYSNALYGTTQGLKGLGAIECLSQFILCNVDNNPSNLMVDSHLQIYKIDGEDVCWSPTYLEELKELSKLKKNLNQLYGNNPHYTQEFNSILLRYLILPHVVLETFRKIYHLKPQDYNALCSNQNFLTDLTRTKNKKNEIFFQQFIDYAISQNAWNDIQDFSQHLKDFVISGKNTLIPQDINIHELITENFIQIQLKLKYPINIEKFIHLQQPMIPIEKPLKKKNPVAASKKNLGLQQMFKNEFKSIILLRPIEQQIAGLILIFMSMGLIVIFYGGISPYLNQFFIKKESLKESQACQTKKHLLIK